MNKNNKKGFTLAELLIVVAIIGVLVAISIPIFSAQLDKAKNATNEANARSYYAQLVADYLDDNTYTGTANGWAGGSDADITYDGNTYHFTKVKSAKLTVNTTNAPVVTYTDLDGNNVVFGTASAS